MRHKAKGAYHCIGQLPLEMMQADGEEVADRYGRM